MVIRFLQTVPSESPEHPFVAGQVIYVDHPSRFLLALLDGVRAEVVRTDDETEHAVVTSGDQPEPVKTRTRRHAKH